MAHGREHLMNWRILYKGQIFEQTSKIKKKKFLVKSQSTTMNSSNFYLSHHHNNFKYVSFSCGKHGGLFQSLQLYPFWSKQGRIYGKTLTQSNRSETQSITFRNSPTPQAFLSNHTLFLHFCINQLGHKLLPFADLLVVSAPKDIFVSKFLTVSEVLLIFHCIFGDTRSPRLKGRMPKIQIYMVRL